MLLDLFTATLFSAVVVIVSGAIYLIGTLLRRDGAAGRLWSMAFLSGIGTVASYLVWVAHPSTLLAVALGNAAFVAAAGFMWLGCAAFNRRPMRNRSVVVATAVVVSFVAALGDDRSAGGWAGALPMFVAGALLSASGAIETRMGRMGSRWDVLGLTIALGGEAVFLGARAIVFFALGPEHEVFHVWLGSSVAALFTSALTIVAVITASVLRASESNLRGHRDTVSLRVGYDGVILPASFRLVVLTMLEGAQLRGETVCLIAVRIDDLTRLAMAFGPAQAEAVATAWRAGVRRHAPTASVVGEWGARTLIVAFVTTSYADVRRLANLIHRRLLDDFGQLETSVVPSLGVGVALTDQLGYEFSRLAEAADEAAEGSMSSSDTSVVVAEG